MHNSIIWLFYDLGILIYGFVIHLSAIAVPKAKDWVKGRKDLYKSRKKIPPDRKVIWFHCASLGEFEQGRPLIEAIREQFPEYYLILTFFSPSGYEIRKDYQEVDMVTYIPLDRKVLAKKFVEMIDPHLAIFVKYEFWFRHLQVLQEKKVPVVLISSVFRTGQIFFKSYGRPFKEILERYASIHVQDMRSLAILRKFKFKNGQMSGDTRVDRVIQLSAAPVQIPEIRDFADRRMLILGSVWQADEKVFLPFLRSKPEGWKFIIAPHEPDKYYIERYEAMFGNRLVRLSRMRRYNPETHDILLIDSVGILGSVYQYGDLAYVGGGFGHGIHNILEPVAFKLPVAFGPNHEKFNEAGELISVRAAFSVADQEAFDDWVENCSDQAYKSAVQTSQSLFLNRHAGATGKIIEDLITKNLI
jgi:3-deoxy-D-manno-octulosonic-acid transferase